MPEHRREPDQPLGRDRLRLGVAQDALAALAAAHPGLAHAAHRRVDAGEGGREGLVDVDGAAPDLARDRPGAGAVLAVDRGVQAVLPRVGPGDRVGLVVEAVERRSPGRRSRGRSRSSPGVTPSRMVGSKKNGPRSGRARPPVSTRAPLATASSTWATTVSSWAWLISEPMSLPQSRVGAERHRLGAGHEPLDEPVVDLVGDEQPLHRDAELAGVRERRRGRRPRRPSRGRRRAAPGWGSCRRAPASSRSAGRHSPARRACRWRSSR